MKPPSLESVFYACVMATLFCYQLGYGTATIFFASAAAAAFLVELVLY